MAKTIVEPTSSSLGMSKTPIHQENIGFSVESPTTKELSLSFSKPALTLGLGVALIGFGGIVGHFLELPWLRSAYELNGYELSPIALGLLFLGIAVISTLAYPTQSQQSRWLKLISNSSLLISGGIGLYFVLMDLAGAHFNLLNLFVQNTPNIQGVPSFISAFNLLLSTTLLYIFATHSRSSVAVVYLVDIPAIFIWNLSLLGLFGHYYDLPVLYNFNMSLPDALAYFGTSIAILIGTISFQGLLTPIISPIPKVRWLGYAAIALGLFALVYGINAIAQLIEPSRILEELNYRRSYVSFLLATISLAILTKTLGLRSAQAFNTSALHVAEQAHLSEREMVIQQILQAVRSSLNLTEIFEKIVNELGSNLTADRCFITRYQMSSQQLSPPSREFLSSDQFPTMIGTEQKLSKAPDWLDYMIAQGKPIDFYPDTPGFYPDITEYLKEIQVQSGIACAITYQGEGMAILFVHQCENKRIWTADEKTLIQTAAGQLGIAIHQANRLEAAQVQANQQKGVAEISQRGLLGIELPILIDQAVELVAATLKMDFGNVLEHLPEQEAFKLVSGHGLKHGLSRNALTEASITSQAGYTLASHKAIIVNNFESETRFTGMPFLQDHSVASSISVTIYGYAHELPYGILGIYSKEPRWFSQDDIHFVEAIASVLGMAIERKRNEHLLKYSRNVAKAAQASAEVQKDKAEKSQEIAENSEVKAKAAQIVAEAAQVLAEAAQATAETAQARAELMSEALSKSEDLLKQYALQLEQSNQDLDQFASVAAHDLQAPLRKVKVFSEQLKQDEKNSLTFESQDLLLRIQKSIRAMQDLIDDLLALSQISKGKPFVTVDLERILQEVQADLSGEIKERQAQVKVGALCSVEGDASQLRRLFQNLVENGLKFQRAESIPQVSISSSATMNDGHCVIEVQDNGIGIDLKNAERVFRIFERLNGKSTYPGTGIGLAICKRIAERHNGSIEVVSELGKGSVFIVKLPIQAIQENTSARNPALGSVAK